MKDILVKALGIIISDSFQIAFDEKLEDAVPLVFAMDLLKQQLGEEDWTVLETSTLFDLASALTLGDIIQAAKV